MVLTDLGRTINRAFATLLRNEAAIDEKVRPAVLAHVLALDDLLKEVCKALLEADVNVRLVQTLRKNVKDAVRIKEQPAGINKKRLIQNVPSRHSRLGADCRTGRRRRAVPSRRSGRCAVQAEKGTGECVYVCRAAGQWEDDDLLKGTAAGLCALRASWPRSMQRRAGRRG